MAPRPLPQCRLTLTATEVASEIKARCELLKLLYMHVQERASTVFLELRSYLVADAVQCVALCVCVHSDCVLRAHSVKVTMYGHSVVFSLCSVQISEIAPAAPRAARAGSAGGARGSTRTRASRGRGSAGVTGDTQRYHARVLTVISGALPLERAAHRYTRALHITQGHHRPDMKARVPVSDGRQQLALKAAEADL